MTTRRPPVRPLPPRITAPRLGDVAAADPRTITAHDMHEGARYDGVDLSGWDLTGATFSECELVGWTADDALLRSGGFQDTVIDRLSTASLRADRSSWLSVSVSGSRLGSVEMYDAMMRNVVVRGSKIDWWNLRGAELRDVAVRGCSLGDVDLSGVRAQRVAFEDCRIDSLTLDRARLVDVDLRGAELGAVNGVEGLRGVTMSATQVALLAPVLAAHLGIDVRD